MKQHAKRASWARVLLVPTLLLGSASMAAFPVHAAQVELMIMLGADSIQTQDFSFTVDVEIGNSTVRNYLNSRHQLVVNMMNRTDFP